ncbi:uncharacterized protein F5147DRAFT_659334 [Suillus discolor]|uniref:Uncharacterized protein n=1 Tax=Suillus discolor TaxID=1912936 RepID=A0A9P7ESN6_9AGAM|nr:uncharacterized protein F5147DRAFT_659334 [Suillus discolor]KAG2086017.1 hypothetical protein F5147DRAFT_659334 [Suillus discolor]
MSKCAASSDDAPTGKRIRMDEGSQTAPLADERAWRILEEFLTTDMTYPRMEEAFLAKPEICCSPVTAKHMSQAPCAPKVPDRRLSQAHVRPSHRPAKYLQLPNPYLDLYAGKEDEEDEGEDDDDDEDGKDEDNDDGKGGDDNDAWKVTHLPGSSSATRFTAVINSLANRFKDTQRNSLLDHQVLPYSIPGLVASASARSHDGRMYLLHVHRNVTDYIAEHLRKENFCVMVSAWLAGQLYVVADSPKTISESLPFSLHLAVKRYDRISDEECEAVKRSCRQFPNPAWVRFKHDKYKGDIAQVFDSDLPNDVVAVLVPPRELPYPMPRGSRSLLDRSRLPNEDAVSDINHGEEVIGCKYNGERYYMGLLLKKNMLSALMLTTYNSTYNLGGTKLSSNQLCLRKPGDVVRVARGPEYPAKGVVRSVDFPNTCLTLLSEIDHSLVHVPIGFVIKVYNVSLDSFKKDIGQEVFIIGGGRKGYRATLYSFNSTDCTVALHGQQHTKIQLKDVATRYGMRLNGAMLEGPDISSASIANPSSITWTNWGASSEDLGMAGNPSSLNPSQTADPWTVDINDMLHARTEKTEKSLLAWLMSKEFLSKFTTYHAMLKVSPSFMGGRLHNRFVSTACLDPFLGQNGPASEGCVAVFCSSNTAGAAIQHYHIPATDLSPAPPRKKNQQCIVLDGSYRGCVFNVAKCFLKKNTVDIAVTPSVFINLRFDQICLVEQSRITM